MTVAHALSEFAQKLRYETIPAAVSKRAKLLLLDAVGAAFASTKYEFSSKALAGLRRFGEGDSPVIGFDTRLGFRDAVRVNGVLVHGLDYDDTYLPGSVHLTASNVPSALGMAFETGASGRDLLMALTLGLEAGARVAVAGMGGFQAAGFHPTGICGAMSSSLVAGRLWGLSTQQQTWAQGIALSMASGTMQPMQDGSWTKRIHPGWAAAAGITAAAMASEDFVGPEEAYEGRYGFYNLFLGSKAEAAQPQRVMDGLGSDWQFTRSSIKLYPACHQSHAFMNAALKLVKQHNIKAAEIESVRTLVSEMAVPLVCEPLDAKRKPDSSYLAQFSLPYAMASCFGRGRYGLAELEKESYTDPALVDLAHKVSYELDPNSGYPKTRTGEVIVKLRDGRTLSQRDEILPDEPAPEADIVRKFVENVAMVRNEARAQELCALIMGLDTEPDVRRVVRELGK